MNPIYRTRWGAYVDLSKIVAINNPIMSDPFVDILISFQLIDKPVPFCFWSNNPGFSPKVDPDNNTEAFKKDLINAWNKYKLSLEIDEMNKEIIKNNKEVE